MHATYDGINGIRYYPNFGSVRTVNFACDVCAGDSLHGVCFPTVNVEHRGYLPFTVNTKYISSSVLKILMFSTHEMKYIWYLPKKGNFLFISYFFEDLREVLKMQKRKILANLNNLEPKYSSC